MIRGICLANNFGQWAAATCGIEKAKGEFIITIDDDLQYKTQDINTLIEHLHQNKLFLVYGIPRKIVNNVQTHSWRQNMRNGIVNTILGKHLTSSFKVFHRNIVFGQDGKLIAYLHFEALENWGLSPKYKDYIAVDLNERKHGSSGYNLLKKIKLLIKYGKEYPKKYIKFLYFIGIFVLMCSCFLLGLFLLRRDYVPHHMSYHIFTAVLFGLGVTLISIGILSSYITSIFLMQKGLPPYIILEETT